jgi:RimJ/RimL family protein N-acetyltransferase
MPKPILELDPKYGLCLSDKYSDLNVSLHEVEGLARDNALEVTISTQKTMLFSTGQAARADKDELGELVKLFQDDKVYPTFNAGTPIPEAKVTELYLEKCKLWDTGDPFGPFVIENQTDGAFVGLIFMESCGPHPIRNEPMPGCSNLGVAITGAMQSKGFGTQAIAAITYGWAPYIARRGYLVNGAPLTTLCAAVRKDNGPANTLPAAGFKHVDTFMHPTHNEYSCDVQEAIAVRNRSRARFLAS